jgi:hypothetical protein
MHEFISNFVFMKIETYISQLLHRYQCVIVPDFGAFLTDFQSARLLDNSNTFYPPRKVVSFNSNITNNDGLLANHIAQIEKISFEKAIQNIDNEVTVWKNNLYNNTAVNLENVGKIALNTDKNLVFEASNTVNFYTNSFGLSTFISPIVKRETQVAIEPVKEETPIISIAENQKSNYNYLKYAAVAVVSLGITTVLAGNYYQNQVLAETQLVEIQVQKEIQNKIQEATFFIKNPLPNVTLTVKESEMPFHVVAGAFRKESNAQRIFEKLSNQGFKSRRLEKNKFGLFPVLYGSYATYAEAHQAMLEIRKNQSPEAWLMVKKL